MIQTIYVPDVWKDLKLEFKEEIYEKIDIKIDLDIDIDLSLLEPKGIRNFKNTITPKTPLPKRIDSSQRSSTIYNKSIDSSSSTTNYDKRIEASKRRSAKYNEKYNERIKNNKKKMENNLIHHCVIS